MNSHITYAKYFWTVQQIIVVTFLGFIYPTPNNPMYKVVFTTIRYLSTASQTQAGWLSHFVFVPLYCRKYKKLLRQEKSTEKKNKYRKGEKHEVCSSFWIHYSIEKPRCGNISLWRLLHPGYKDRKRKQNYSNFLQVYVINDLWCESIKSVT